MQVVVLPGDVEEEGIALLAGVLRGAGVGRDVEGLVLENGRADGEHDVGEDDAGHEIDLVLLQELVGCLLGDVRILLVVGNQYLSRQIAQLAAEMLDAQLETVADIDAEAGPGPDRVETRPTLILSAAWTEPASSRAAARAVRRGIIGISGSWGKAANCSAGTSRYRRGP